MTIVAKVDYRGAAAPKRTDKMKRKEKRKKEEEKWKEQHKIRGKKEEMQGFRAQGEHQEGKRFPQDGEVHWVVCPNFDTLP